MGDMVLIKITEQLYQYVSEHGGLVDIGKNDGSIFDLIIK